MLKSGLVNVVHDYSGHGEFPGTNGNSREQAAEIFRRSLQEARSEIRAAQERGGLGGIQSPDEGAGLFGDFEREAEENYQKLRESKLFRDQRKSRRRGKRLRLAPSRRLPTRTPCY